MASYHDFLSMVLSPIVGLMGIHIGNSSGDIEQTHSRFVKCPRIFGTKLNGHQIGILDNLFD